jgi:alanine racemase
VSPFQQLSPGRAESQAVLTIDLAALAANWRALAARVAPARCGAVIKADAYGIGLEPAARALRGAGCTTFFVAHVSEGMRARAALGADDAATLYVLNGLPPGDDRIALYETHDLQPVLGTLDEIARWQAGAPARPAALHVDTGMNRLGLGTADLAGLASARPAFPISLLMSHFASSEVTDDPLNQKQMERFASTRAAFPDVAGSLANSSGLFLPQRPFHDLVRPGYALYGGNPTPGAPNPMRAVVRLEAPILQLRRIEPGETVGYNAQWTARRPTRLATIGIGYADGLPRNAMATDQKPGGEAMVAGIRCPFAGRVSMDLITLDVTDVPDAGLAPGALACLLGDEIGIDDLGARAGTIGYEILTNLGRRYHRIHLGA